MGSAGANHGGELGLHPEEDPWYQAVAGAAMNLTDSTAATDLTVATCPLLIGSYRRFTVHECESMFLSIGGFDRALCQKDFIVRAIYTEP
jgi:hypothetical protein